MSFDQYERLQLSKLASAPQSEIQGILDSVKAAGSLDTALLKKLYIHAGTFWKASGNSGLAAYYYYKYAEKEGTKTALSNAGDALSGALKQDADTLISNNLITFALRSYEEAIQKDGSDVELRIKLAELYVQGTQDPMKGIGMLRQLADSLPDNIPVMLALGKLSIQSGQMDKAKERFKKVLKLQPQNTEALYFLAITEAQSGNTDEAIRLFEMCKELIGNKEFSKEIDEIVKNLKSKKV